MVGSAACEVEHEPDNEVPPSTSSRNVHGTPNVLAEWRDSPRPPVAEEAAVAESEEKASPERQPCSAPVELLYCGGDPHGTYASNPCAIHAAGSKSSTTTTGFAGQQSSAAALDLRSVGRLATNSKSETADEWMPPQMVPLPSKM